MKPKTGKRIVSKSEYVAKVVDKTYLYAVGAAIGVLCLLCLVSIVVLLFELHQGEVPASDLPLFLFLVLAIIGGAWFLFLHTKRVLHAANEIESGIPLTRANTGHLPASESLARASVEPAQAQEMVLLRAAAEGQETPPEQLVRGVQNRLPVVDCEGKFLLWEE